MFTVLLNLSHEMMSMLNNVLSTYMYQTACKFELLFAIYSLKVRQSLETKNNECN